MLALARIGYQDFIFCTDAVPFLIEAFPVNLVGNNYHPVKDFEGVEIKLINSSKVILNEEEQDKDYKGKSEQYNNWWTEERKKSEELDKKNKELVEKNNKLAAQLKALKEVCHHGEED